MEQHEKDMQLIAILSGELGEDYIFTDCDTESLEHTCRERNNEMIRIDLCDVEYFKEGKVKTEKANFCEYCNQVFLYRPHG